MENYCVRYLSDEKKKKFKIQWYINSEMEWIKEKPSKKK